MKSLILRLNSIGYEKTRRALAALSLSFFISLYLLVALNSPPGWGPAFLALSGCYLIAFLSVAAEWFWGRWFASGLAWSGVMISAFALFMVGWSPPLALYGGLHGLVMLALMGQKMADRYDQQEGWRQRYGMDEFGVARLRKTVTRASASLPSLILWALGPKEPAGMGEGLFMTGVGIAALLLAAAGLRGLITMRSWGLLALAASALALFIGGNGASPFYGSDQLASIYGGLGAVANLPNVLGLGATFAGGLLVVSLLPFAGPAFRYLANRR